MLLRCWDCEETRDITATAQWAETNEGEATVLRCSGCQSPNVVRRPKPQTLRGMQPSTWLGTQLRLFGAVPDAEAAS